MTRPLMVLIVALTLLFGACSSFRDILVFNPCDSRVSVWKSADAETPSGDIGSWGTEYVVEAQSGRLLPDVIAEGFEDPFGLRVQISDRIEVLTIERTDADPIPAGIPAAFCDSESHD